ncbi:hypothetical protein T03_384 [Trichinella britovi]|uniref:Uncharacterized protein n=1 Tax=Trichinella britovi TaxID=45882 RepID=A0A0V1C8B8_TRIBR|nr:hypothetical protein T03_384 [Trichinella britovi]
MNRFELGKCIELSRFLLVYYHESLRLGGPEFNERNYGFTRLLSWWTVSLFVLKGGKVKYVRQSDLNRVALISVTITVNRN